jgi:hypothetical protein
LPNERPPFDAVRACFWLIAGVLAAHCMVALASIGWCIYHGDSIVGGRYSCENIGSQLNQLLTAALAAALAFAGGLAKK